VPLSSGQRSVRRLLRELHPEHEGNSRSKHQKLLDLRQVRFKKARTSAMAPRFWDLNNLALSNLLINLQYIKIAIKGLRLLTPPPCLFTYDVTSGCDVISARLSGPK